MTRSTLRLTALAAASILALSACAGDDEPASPEGAATSATHETDHGGHGDHEAPDDDAEYTAADVTFAQMMIPHHEQAIEMSDIVLAKDGVPQEVVALAEEIKAAQGPEIEQLTAWLDQWGEPAEPHGDHDMSEMDGMLSAEEIQGLAEAEGADAARMFLEQMIEHHEGAVAMAQDEVAGGGFPPAIELAETIIETQNEEIALMNDLLATL